MARRGTGNELIVICWRDIPAQVNGGSGESKHQQILPHRFHQAIDRAAMKAGKWGRRKVALPVDFDGDFAAAARAEAERIEADFPTARLKLWVETGGWDPDRPDLATLNAAPADQDTAS